ncbi:hypothetical protein [Leptolyngbya sp. KIOST-1]|uniref:hypothetical protein n=1 Tax=Leptolyngbya sp. KIOST-1 TaxID=1229172 RepID=UPI00056AD291|nr:hypothetical protein [Leptolyngbya sp. KIOST-1]
MRNPFSRLKSLPWVILLQVALAAVAIATLADLLLAQALALLLANVGSGLMPLLRLVFMVLPIAAGFAIGFLALTVLERWFNRQVYIDTGVLWALVPCIALVLFIKGFLPIPAALVTMSYPLIVGVLLGIFVIGKRYWRRW